MSPSYLFKDSYSSDCQKKAQQLFLDFYLWKYGNPKLYNRICHCCFLCKNQYSTLAHLETSHRWNILLESYTCNIFICIVLKLTFSFCTVIIVLLSMVLWLMLKVIREITNIIALSFPPCELLFNYYYLADSGKLLIISCSHHNVAILCFESLETVWEIRM